MDTLSAFAMGEANRGKEMMVFDWDRAAEIIRERGARSAAAGLEGGLGYTGGIIFQNGKIEEEEYTYLASTWAKPILRIGVEDIYCFKMQSQTDGWDSSTKWPDSAKEILNA